MFCDQSPVCQALLQASPFPQGFKLMVLFLAITPLVLAGFAAYAVFLRRRTQNVVRASGLEIKLVLASYLTDLTKQSGHRASWAQWALQAQNDWVLLQQTTPAAWLVMTVVRPREPNDTDSKQFIWKVQPLHSEPEPVSTDARWLEGR